MSTQFRAVQKEVAPLYYLEFNDYFVFQGKEQMYFVVKKNSEIISYKSTYSGRVYTVYLNNFKSKRLVVIHGYGS